MFKSGPITIGRGELAETIYDWLLVKTVAFDFKINKISRGRRFVAVLSDLGGYRCCSIPNALFAVYSGNQTFLLNLRQMPVVSIFAIFNQMSALSEKVRNWIQLRLAQGNCLNTWEDKEKI